MPLFLSYKAQTCLACVGCNGIIGSHVMASWPRQGLNLMQGAIAVVDELLASLLGIKTCSRLCPHV